jgi:putative N6-adenine-specific DNA methylase
LAQAFLEGGRVRPGIRFSVITPDESFEHLAGGVADKRRKLYNGMIKCTLYQYFRQRSPDR